MLDVNKLYAKVLLLHAKSSFKVLNGRIVKVLNYIRGTALAVFTTISVALFFSVGKSFQ